MNLGQRPFIKKWINFNWKWVEIDGKDHPVTSYISLYPPGTNFLDYFYIFRIWTQNGPTFSSFSNLSKVKRPRPKGKKMRMDHPFILGFCQNLTLYFVCSTFSHFLVKTNFLKLLLDFNYFVYPRFKNGRPQIIIISE